jgi:hypothetical protein
MAVAAGESPGELATDPAPWARVLSSDSAPAKKGEEESKETSCTVRGASSASDCVALQDGPVKGAPSGRVAKAMAQAPPLTVPSFQAVSGSFRMRHLNQWERKALELAEERSNSDAASAESRTAKATSTTTPEGTGKGTELSSRSSHGTFAVTTGTHGPGWQTGDPLPKRARHLKELCRTIGHITRSGVELSGSDHLSDIEKARKDLLWGMYQEMRTHARHAETLRSSVISYTLVLTSALIVVITFDKKVNHADVLLCAAIAIIGLVSTGFAASYAELYHRNRLRAEEFRNLLDTLFFGGECYTIAKLLYDADCKHEDHKFYRWSRQRTGSTHGFWLVPPILVFSAGIASTIYASIA